MWVTLRFNDSRNENIINLFKEKIKQNYIESIITKS